MLEQTVGTFRKRRPAYGMEGIRHDLKGHRDSDNAACVTVARVGRATGPAGLERVVGLPQPARLSHLLAGGYLGHPPGKAAQHVAVGVRHQHVPRHESQPLKVDGPVVGTLYFRFAAKAPKESKGNLPIPRIASGSSE